MSDTMVWHAIRSNITVTRHSELELLPFSEFVSSTIYYMSWQLTTDSLTRGIISNLIGPDF